MIKDQEGTDLIAGRIGTDSKELRDETSNRGHGSKKYRRASRATTSASILDLQEIEGGCSRRVLLAPWRSANQALG